MSFPWQASGWSPTPHVTPGSASLPVLTPAESWSTGSCPVLRPRPPGFRSDVLPLAGLRMVTDTTRDPRLGISTSPDSSGIVVNGVVPGAPAEAAGVRAGDR